ncbi:MAG: site-specific tyrosine recombinase XerC [Deltaproteobacteria bacterium]|nr:site-specific tyrosine recombinase XerC [Deltaproteobacteria bacterium]
MPGSPRDPDGFSNRVRQHLDGLRVHGFSEETIETRGRYLTYFAVWCADRSLGRPNEIVKPILERYQRWLYYYRSEDGRPLSFQSQHHRLSALKVFFRWLAKENYILSNPASELELPKVGKRLPKSVLTPSEIERVLSVADVKTPLGIRDRAMMETFYSSGIRRGELLRLKLYDLDQERGTIAIRQGKGNKDRVVPVGDRALAWLDKYTGEVRPTLVCEPDEGTVFLTARGAEFLRENLTSLIAGYVERSGIGKKGSCHLFRHAMATAMLENGADIRFIQALLGHSRIETTQIYTEVSIKKLKEIHSATHPARMKKKRTAAASAAAPDIEDLLSTLTLEEQEEDIDQPKSN